MPTLALKFVPLKVPFEPPVGEKPLPDKYIHALTNTLATSYSYTSARGLMKVMTGNQFTTVMKSYGI